MDQLVRVVDEFHQRGVIDTGERDRLLSACLASKPEPEVVLGLMHDFAEWLEFRGQPFAAEGLRQVISELDEFVSGALPPTRMRLPATSRFVRQFAPQEEEALSAFDRRRDEETEPTAA